MCRSELEALNSELNERLTSLKLDNESLTTALAQVVSSALTNTASIIDMIIITLLYY